MIQSLERRIPNHFLVIALIQQLCSLYIEDKEKCEETFNGIFMFIVAICSCDIYLLYFFLYLVICGQLARMKVSKVYIKLIKS